MKFVSHRHFSRLRAQAPASPIPPPAARSHALTLSRSARPPRPSERGIALIMVMIAIFVLAVLAGRFAYAMKIETKLAQNANSEAELEWLGRSGVEYARWVLSLSMQIPQQPYDALNQPWATGYGDIGPTNAPMATIENPVPMPNGSFHWKITDLESKANINSADEGMLERALMVMGVDAGDQAKVVGSILDWIDPDDVTHPGGAESDVYKRAEPPYSAKNGPIDDLSELLLIDGVTPELYWGTGATNHPPGALQPRQPHFNFNNQPPAYPIGLTGLFTPLSTGKININTASAEVLQLLPGVDRLIAEAIVAGRQGEDDGSGLLGPYRSVQDIRRIPEIPQGGPILPVLQQFCDVRSRTFQVEVDAEIGGYKRQFVAILGRNTPKDIQILAFYWK